ncbi:MAG: hypothetical protein J7J93_01275 [Candidatus Aenigmarchaeota archaeon]|nr:hypothetical protein [Candidatus Aenigmarchaeota archaeon]
MINRKYPEIEENGLKNSNQLKILLVIFIIFSCIPFSGILINNIHKWSLIPFEIATLTPFVIATPILLLHRFTFEIPTFLFFSYLFLLYMSLIKLKGIHKIYKIILGVWGFYLISFYIMIIADFFILSFSSTLFPF